MFRLFRERDGKSGPMGVKAVTICPLCHTRALVPIFVLEWRKFGAPDRMKLGTPMSLLFLTNCRTAFDGPHTSDGAILTNMPNSYRWEPGVQPLRVEPQCGIMTLSVVACRIADNAR